MLMKYKNIKKKIHTLHILFFIRLKKYDQAYFQLFFLYSSEKDFIAYVYIEKFTILLRETRPLQQFYSNYFYFSIKVKKNDLSVCQNIIDLCNELQENYPKMNRIEKYVQSLFTGVKKTIDIYNILMKDYQNLETIENYGSFLLKILKDSSGRRYTTLSKLFTHDKSNNLEDC